MTDIFLLFLGGAAGRLFRSVGGIFNDSLASFECQSVDVSAFRNLVVLLFIGNVDTVRAVENFQFRFFVKLLDQFFLFGIRFALDKLDGFFQSDAVRSLVFRNGNKLAVMLHIRTEAADGHCHILAFVVAQCARKVEELQGFFQRNVVHRLSFQQRCELRLFVAVRAAQLNERTKAANSSAYRCSAVGRKMVCSMMFLLHLLKAAPSGYPAA